MSVSLVVKGTKSVRNQFGRFIKETPKVLQQALFLAASQVRKEAIDMIKTGDKSGTHWPGLPNPSSAPGEAPATQSNRLANNINVIATTERQYVVKADTPYAAALEFGHFARGKDGNPGTIWVAPRPFLMPAFNKVKPVMDIIVKRAWADGDMMPHPVVPSGD